MGTPNETETTKAEEARAAKEWTVMFYFASDNPLAPGIVSQLKAIKEAGFHVDANVIAQFDPHTQNTPPHVFDVNLAYRLKAQGRSQVGFGSNDPYVRSLVTDKLWGEKDESIKARIKNSLNARRRPNEAPIDYNPPSPCKEMFQEQNPKEALEYFLDFCKREYPAHHYMLFILGHGLVVGNDLFLYDENTPRQAQVPGAEVVLHAQPAENGNGKAKVQDKEPLPSEHSLLLKDLGAALDKFTNGNKGVLELVSFHSCSMSSLEVAYQLQNKAKYMLASQGTAFVGSWPYRQILIRLFNDLESSEITEDDLCGAAALVNELNNPTNAVSTYLCNLFGAPAVAQLREHDGSSELKREILNVLLNSLNSALTDPKLFIANKDKVKWLSEATRRQFSLMSQQPNGQPSNEKDLKRLNRLFLTDVYPDMIAKVSVKKMLTRMFYYCLYNSYDFQLAGYSFDLCLCDLSKIKGITKPLSSLSEKLQEGLRDENSPIVQQLILLAHWDAQSFWQESYTDLYDFCFRLKCRCDDAIQSSNGVSNSKNELERLKEISDASNELMLALKRGVRGDDDRIIVRSEFAGAAYQYSHGLSVFFPWTRPVDSFFSDQYKDYKFKDTGWSGFLETYFDITRRKPRLAEVDPLSPVIAMNGVEEELLELLQDISTRVYTNDGQLSKGGGNDRTGRGGGNDPTGDDCSCPTIKNYPPFIRTPPAVVPVGGRPIAAAIEPVVPEGNGVRTKEARLSPDFTLGV